MYLLDRSTVFCSEFMEDTYWGFEDGKKGKNKSDHKKRSKIGNMVTFLWALGVDLNDPKLNVQFGFIWG